MNVALRDELIALDTHDQAVRAELAADGSLFNGYHPRMEAVHLANADRLAAIIEEFGWPGVSLVGEGGAFAAWRIAQHSISRPAFMRQCRDLVDLASLAGDCPRRLFAYLDDRIRVFTQQPQRFGTQLRNGPNSLEPEPLIDPEQVETWRREVGLPPLEEIIAKARQNPEPKPIEDSAAKAAELAWKIRVGWIASPTSSHLNS